MKGIINVFAGYQFSSEYFNRSELDDAIAWACDTAASDISKKYEVDMKYNPVDITPGNIIIEGLKSLINASDICIFEASDLNNNVFIELGMSLAFNKPIIILINSSASNTIKLPSDISGIVYCKYTDIGKLKAKLSRILFDITLKVLMSDKANPYQNTLRHIWMGHSETEVVIVGGEIWDIAPSSQIGKTYCVQSGDVKALVEAAVNVAILNEKARINIYSRSSIRGADLSKNLIIIGGPRSNLITKRILNKLDILPWKIIKILESGEKFIIHNKNKNKLTAKIINDKVDLDYFTVVSGPNPFNPQTRFSLFAGLYTFGVLGGVRAFSPRMLTSEVLHNINGLLEKKWDGHEIIQIVSKVDVIDDEVVTPSIDYENIEVLTYE